MTTGPHLLVLEHDPQAPIGLLDGWLRDAGAEVEIRRLHAGDAVPDDPAVADGIISLGGDIGIDDTDRAGWLPATKTLLAAAVKAGTPTLGIGLGAQLLAVATGGRVERGDAGPEIGAYLAAKRDITEFDLIFGEVPISPDVMQFHADVITALPPGGALMLSSPGYPNQAFRIGSAGWGTLFHIETTAADIRRWRDGDASGAGRRAIDESALARSERRCGALLDEAEAAQRVVWKAFAERFVAAARDGVPPTPTGWAGPRLPIAGTTKAG